MAAPQRRRSRFRTFLLIALAITAFAHTAFVVALGRFLPPLGALALGVAVGVLCALRMRATVFDRRRAGWIVALVDLPTYWHWGACMVSTPLFVLSLPALLLDGVRAVDLAGAAYVCGLLVSAWSIWGRRRFVRVRRLELPIPGLPAAFDGYRIVHLSDLHVGNFDDERRARRWVERANSLEPDLAAVTGDLVTSGTHFYPDAARALSGLRAADGRFVSLGNHDQWDPDALERELSERGLTVLRNAWHRVERAGEQLIVAGVDDRWVQRDDLDQALAGRPDNACTVLLAHHPTLHERAAAASVELVLSGHTHGGQVGVPFAADRLNIARAAGQHSRGLYTQGKTHMYVHAGLGTTGPPMRLGIPPEIALLVLRAVPAV